MISRVLREVKQRIPALRIGTMLDFETGPGTAMWAAGEYFTQLSCIVGVEDIVEWITVGKLELCTPRSLEREMVSKKRGPRYKEARKAGLGDTI